MTASSRRCHFEWLSVAAILLAAVVAFLTSLPNGFALDDVPVIQQNPVVHSLDDITQLWTTSYWPVSGTALGLYRPLTTFLFAIQWVVGGGDAWLFHAVSIVLHGAASVLVFWLLLSVLKGARRDRLLAALVGGVAFAVHPIHTEAVANIVGQAELTAAIAVLAACCVHAGRPAGARLGAARLAALMILYVAALSAKEHAVVLPALLIMIDLAQGRVEWRRDVLLRYFRQIGPLVVALALIVLMYLAARAVVLGSLIGSDANPAYPYLRGDSRTWNALRAWPEFYRLLFFPADLSADYSPGIILPVDGPTAMTVTGGLLLLLTILVALRYWRNSLVGLAAAWLLISILPVSNLLFPIGVLVAERTLYLPSVAVSMLIAAGAAFLLPTLEQNRRRNALIVATAVLVVLGVRTAVRNPVWRSTNTVTASVVRTHPESYRAQWTMAAAALRAQDTARARFHYELGYRIYDQDPVYVAEYGNYHIGQGDLAGALPYLQQARGLQPGFPRARIYSAYVFNRTGRPDSALSMLNGFGASSRDAAANRRLILAERARALDGLKRYNAASAVWHVVAREAGRTAWVYHALRGRSLARAGHRSLALNALADARIRAPGETERLAVDALVELVESGCFGAGSCERDPLIPWTGS